MFRSRPPIWCYCILILRIQMLRDSICQFRKSRPPQGIKAIPSEYTCLKKIVTPSDHDLNNLRGSVGVNICIYLTIQHTVDLRHVIRQRREPRHAQFPSPRCASHHQHCDFSVRPSPHRSLSQREDGIAPAQKGFRLRVPTVFEERRKTAARLSASEEPGRT